MTDHTLSPPPSILQGTRLWQPTLNQMNDTQVKDFAGFVLLQHGFDWGGDFQALWQWSVNNISNFWKAMWQWHGIIGDMGSQVLINESKMPGARFFPDAKLNFAENLLVDADDQPALSAHGEDGRHLALSRAELKRKVMALAGWLKTKNVSKGDRVVAFTPNNAEAVITMLATATLGAVYSSCSPDFGVNGAIDRFGQIEPKILMACDGYLYAGKKIDRMPLVADLVKKLPTLEAVLILPYLDGTRRHQ